MTDRSIERVDEAVTELVELIETARSVPISGSCIVPREKALDLLDHLREVVPPVVAQSQRIVARRDALLAAAQAEAQRIVGDARTATERRTAAADEQARGRLADASAEAARLVAAGEAENARLVSAAGVHQAATAAAETLRAEADAYAASTRGAALAFADRERVEAAQARVDADSYARDLIANAEDYAERTLGDVIAALRRTAATAEHGRDELAARRAAHTDGAHVGTRDAAGQPAAGEGGPSGQPVFDVRADE